jgi:DNA-binding GntR family transcriptional regulator
MTIIIPKSLTEIAVNELRRMITIGEFKFGAQLAESVLASRFGLSKTPVREALLLLKQEGLVEIHPRKGTFVFAPSAKELRSLLESRAILEPGALRLALERNRVRLLTELALNLESSDAVLKKTNTDKYLQLDRKFHTLFFQHAENPYLNKFNDTVAAKMHAVRYRLAFAKGFINRSITEHKHIFSLLENDGVDEACKALGEHINLCITEENIHQLVAEGVGTCT